MMMQTFSSSPELSDSSRFYCTYPECRKSFSRSSHLSRHMRIHLGTKPFLCGIQGCQKKFSRRDCWREHMRGVHGILCLESSVIPIPAAYPHHQPKSIHSKKQKTASSSSSSSSFSSSSSSSSPSSSSSSSSPPLSSLSPSLASDHLIPFRILPRPAILPYVQPLSSCPYLPVTL